MNTLPLASFQLAPATPQPANATVDPDADAAADAGHFARLMDAQRADPPPENTARHPADEDEEPTPGLVDDWMAWLATRAPAPEPRTPVADGAHDAAQDATHEIPRPSRRGIATAADRSAETPAAAAAAAARSGVDGPADALRAVDDAGAERWRAVPGSHDDASAGPTAASHDGASGVEGVTPLAGADLGRLLPAGATGARAPVATVHVQTPTNDPQFAQALAARVTLLATSQVEQAVLHLHPAELGPVSVQIAMEGTQAHISFSAASNATCQLLESGLPELASALEDAGLDLGSSDVFQHADDPGDAAQQASSSPAAPLHGGQGEPDQIVVQAPRTSARGMLDLFV